MMLVGHYDDKTLVRRRPGSVAMQQWAVCKVLQFIGPSLWWWMACYNGRPSMLDSGSLCYSTSLLPATLSTGDKAYVNHNHTPVQNISVDLWSMAAASPSCSSLALDGSFWAVIILCQWPYLHLDLLDTSVSFLVSDYRNCQEIFLPDGVFITPDGCVDFCLHHLWLVPRHSVSHVSFCYG